jgi:hypothetical protein
MGTIQDRIAACLDGSLPYDALSEFEQSAIRIHVYFRASALLDLPKDKRKQAGEQLPPDIRDLVRDECKRLLEHRRLFQNSISRQTP